MPKNRSAKTFTSLVDISAKYCAMVARNTPSTQPAAREKAPLIQNVSDDGTDTTILLYEEIGFWGVRAVDFVKELNGIATPKVTVRINSPGGSIFDGLAIYNSLRSHKSEINILVDGLAASAASFIAMAGDNIVMCRNATMMIHDGSGMTWGNEADHLMTAALLGKLSDNIADVYSQQANGTADSWRALMRAETWYTGKEALAAGLVDGITDADEEPDPVPEDSVMFSLFKYHSRKDAPDPPLRPVPPPPPNDFDYHAFQRSLLAARLTGRA